MKSKLPSAAFFSSVYPARANLADQAVGRIAPGDLRCATAFYNLFAPLVAHRN
jgi:hypothetical protein